MMTSEELAERLRTALRYIQSISSNSNFYDDISKVSFGVANTLEALDRDFPEFTADERMFISIVEEATGLNGIQKYVTLSRNPDWDYSKMDNGTTFRDHEITFHGALQYAKSLSKKENT